MDEVKVNVEKAIEAIRYESKKFPEEAFKVITEHKNEAIPILRGAIEKAICEGDELEEGYQLHFYALFLLGEFQDREFFPEIMKLAALPEEVLDYLIGDMITSGLKDVIYNTYNGDLELLKNTAMDENVNEFIRSGLAEVMGQLYLDGQLAEDDLKAFIRQNVYAGDEYNYFYIGLAEVICRCHFVDMLPEIRHMLDEDLMDEMAMGKYDSCVDEMFLYWEKDYRFCVSPLNTIESLRNWAMFEDSRAQTKADKLADERKAFDKMLRQMKKTGMQASAVKIGRNDPCPCGSGKKYKFCCLNKPKSPLDSIEDPLERAKALTQYPYTGSERQEGRIYLEDYFDSESIEIDKLLYLGLMNRPGLIWLRDERREEKRCREYLSLAFEKFKKKVDKEGIKSFEEYDQKFSIHYFCGDWLGELLRLTKANGDKALYNSVRSMLKALG